MFDFSVLNIYCSVNSNGKVVKSIECYDDQSDKWSVVGETKVELYGHSLVAV